VNFCELFVRRPVMTVLVMAGILIFGLASYRLLPVSTLPNVDFPTIQVTAELPGRQPPRPWPRRSPTVLEKQFSTIAGIDEMSSVSGQGVTRITIVFALDRDIDAAAQDVNSAIASAARQLPATMPAPPSFRKVNPADFPVYYLALTSAQLPLSTVNEYAETLPRAAHLHGHRGGAGAGVRPAEVRCARPGRSERARRPRRRHQRGRAGGIAGEREPSHRHALRKRPHVRGAGHRAAARTRRRSGP